MTSDPKPYVANRGASMSMIIKRVTAFVVAACLLAQIVDCSSTRPVNVGPDFATVEAKKLRPPGFSIAGYVTTDGVRHPFLGTVTMEGDVFVLQPTIKEDDTGAPDETAAPRAEALRVPREQVVSFDRYERSRPLLIIGVCLALAAGVIWLGQSVTGD